MKALLFALLFFSVGAFAQTKTVQCFDPRNQEEVLNFELSPENKLVTITEISISSVTHERIEGEKIDVQSWVQTEEDGTQTAEFGYIYTERISLILNVVNKTAKLEYFDTDDWKVSGETILNCSF